MRIAILLAGRITRYKERLIPLLEKYNNENPNDIIDVFMSINDDYIVYYDYYEELKNNINIKKWLKDIHIEKYKIPDNFNNIGTKTHFTNANRGSYADTMLYNSLSCYYNDANVFRMATEYADKNNFDYDIYLRTRAEVVSDRLPIFIQEKSENVLFCAIPIVNFKLYITDNPNGAFIKNKYHCYGPVKFHNKDIIAEIAYGNREAMKIYCSTYDYVLEQNKKTNGELFICNETTLTISILENLETSKCNYQFFKYVYFLDPLRYSK